MKTENKYMDNYTCEVWTTCDGCFWSNGEQCIRQLLDEEEIRKIEWTQKEKSKQEDKE